MNEETKNALLEYEEIKNTIKEHEARLEELKPALLQVIEPNQEVKALYGTFTVKTRDKWVYSPSTTALEEELKGIQKREKADGSASAIPGAPFIEYRQSSS